MTGILATVFWDTVLLLPLKLLIVLVHEIWHGVFALLGGGQLEAIHIDAREAGETLVSGLDSFPGFVLTVSAGYIGSALVGALLLNRGLTEQWVRPTLTIFAVALAAMSHTFTEQGSLASYVGIGWSFAILLLMLPGKKPASVLLVVLGTLFVWYSFFDLFDFTDNVHATDAGILAAYLQRQYTPAEVRPATGLAYTISVIWSAMILGVMYLVLRPVLPRMERAPAPPPEPEPLPMDAQFPGEVTPEVAEWLMQRGYGPDGQPLDFMPEGSLDESAPFPDSAPQVMPEGDEFATAPAAPAESHAPEVPAGDSSKSI